MKTHLLTPLGRFMCGIAGAGCALGATLHWVEAWAVGFAALLALLLATPLLLTRLKHRVVLSVERTAITVGDTLKVSLGLSNEQHRAVSAARVALCLGDTTQQFKLPRLRALAHHEATMTVAPQRRGVIPIGPLMLMRQDALRLMRREITWNHTASVYVRPKTIAMHDSTVGSTPHLDGDATRHRSDSDLQFHSVREYFPGDALNQIHWKSTAKTGKLSVRQYESSRTSARAMLFDPRGDGYASADEFELAVSCAASLSRHADYRSMHAGLHALPASHAEMRMNAWAEIEAQPTHTTLEEMAGRLAKMDRDSAAIDVITGSLGSAHSLLRLRMSLPPQKQLRVVRCEINAEPRIERWQQLTVVIVGVLTDLPRLIARSSQ